MPSITSRRTGWPLLPSAIDCGGRERSGCEGREDGHVRRVSHLAHQGLVDGLARLAAVERLLGVDKLGGSNELGKVVRDLRR